MAGVVTATNNDVRDDPESINNDPYGEGWLIVLQAADASAFERLLTAEQYKTHVEEENERAQ